MWMILSGAAGAGTPGNAPGRFLLREVAAGDRSFCPTGRKAGRDYDRKRTLVGRWVKNGPGGMFPGLDVEASSEGNRWNPQVADL